MMLIYATILIILKLFQNRPAGDQRGPCGRPGAREHRVGDPWYNEHSMVQRLHYHTQRT